MEMIRDTYSIKWGKMRNYGTIQTVNKYQKTICGFCVTELRY